MRNSSDIRGCFRECERVTVVFPNDICITGEVVGTCGKFLIIRQRCNRCVHVNLRRVLFIRTCCD
ncbi:hypothetical protein HAHI6034_03855 [Hathewaya histolytica]|uniref:Uncharacterized protein n=1 Tax=Hathewaya histolytica TaxID=1498 RepID=A0A4U9RSQ0_HATHI|nr:hypothetical protein [Hathewaya histolytica]VTQ94671.1 Uncharacterised protein [Hathewaya histolytica]